MSASQERPASDPDPGKRLDEMLEVARGGDRERCIAELRNLVRERPEFAEAWGHLGYLLFLSGRSEEALACYEVIRDLHPDFAEVYRWLGHCYTALGRFREARKAYLKLRGTPQFESPEVQRLLLQTEPLGRWIVRRSVPFLLGFVRRLPDAVFRRRFTGEMVRLGESLPGIRAAGLGRYLVYLSQHYVQTEDYRLGQDACDLCGCGDFSTVFFFGRQKKVKCRECGLECVERKPRDSLDVAEGTYDEDATIDFYGKLWSESWRFQGRIDCLLSLFREIGEDFPRPGARAFEVGCVHGKFLRYMKEQGMEVAGVETSHRMARYCREELGLDVKRGTVREMAAPPAPYDMLFAYHVVEHLDQPSLFFSKAREMLRPNGLLFVEVPVPDLTHEPLMRQLNDMHGYANEHHLHYFQPNHIRRYLARYGFDHLTGYEYTAESLLPSAGFLARKGT